MLLPAGRVIKVLPVFYTLSRRAEMGGKTTAMWATGIPRRGDSPEGEGADRF